MNSVPITVAIPVGPHESNRRWLREAIESVHNQTVQVNQILIINDSSKPMSRFKKVKVWNTPWRLGVAHAFNFGVALARNDLVFMLGSDDVLAPECIEQCYNCWRKHSMRDAYYWVSLEYMKDGKIQGLPCNAAMVTKELWRQTGGFPIETACGQPDGTFISMMMLHRSDDLIPVNIGYPLYKYRWHEEIDTIRQGAYWDAVVHIRRILNERGFSRF